MTRSNGLKEGYVIINHACENVFSPIRMKPVKAYHNPNFSEPNTPNQATFHKCLHALIPCPQHIPQPTPASFIPEPHPPLKIGIE